MTSDVGPLPLRIADRGHEGEWLSCEERLANVIREVCAGLYPQDEAVALLHQLVEEYVGDAYTEIREHAD